MGCPVKEPVLRKRTPPTAAKTPPSQGPASAARGPKAEPVEAPPLELEAATIFLLVHPDGDASKLSAVLRSHPSLHLALVFPPRYFERPARKHAIDAFRALNSTGTIEIVLTLDNEPILPLLGDLELATAGATDWDVKFAWPRDIGAQIARGSARFQTLWLSLPRGFFPPYAGVSPAVLDAAQKFRLAWVVGAPADNAGIRPSGATSLLAPGRLADVAISTFTLSADLETVAEKAVKRGIGMVDATAWPPQAELLFIEKLAALQAAGRGPELVTPSQFVERFGELAALPEAEKEGSDDYSAWVRTPAQKAAWDALARARRVLEDYKNSGRANLQRLDAAQEEVYSAESGPFLLALGQTQVSLAANQRTFVATLANVYRLCDLPVPDDLNSIFNSAGKARDADSMGSASAPFFEGGDHRLSWNDPADDDVGAGAYEYPAGKYAKGSFDLRQFRVVWSDTMVTFSAVFGAASDLGAVRIAPLVDVYLDVNRLPDAGSVHLLKGRGQSRLERESAWEYGVAFGPSSAALYQSVPGGDARRLSALDSSWKPDTNTVNVSVPRGSLRGDPSQWRFTVLVMGSASSNGTHELEPAPVLARPSERSFGGAHSGRESPPFIDLLAPSLAAQTNANQVYETGRLATLPYADPE
jgi:hypothetical protein